MPVKDKEVIVTELPIEGDQISLLPIALKILTRTKLRVNLRYREAKEAYIVISGVTDYKIDSSNFILSFQGQGIA